MKRVLTICVLLLAALTALAACGAEKAQDAAGTTDKAEETLTRTEETPDKAEETPTPVHTHAFGEWTVIKEATCVEDGAKERVCACGELQTEAIPAAGHRFEDNVCAVCGVNNGEGLKFTPSDDGASYTVAGVGSFREGVLIIPSEHDGKPVTAIGESAFGGCEGLTGVSIPDSVESIGDSAFSDCKRLKSVDFGEGLIEIGNSGFSGCSSLESVTLPDNVYRIGDMVFSYCGSLTDIALPESLCIIGFYAFGGSYRLAEVRNRSGLLVNPAGYEYASNDNVHIYINGESCLDKTEDGFVFFDFHGKVSLVSYRGEQSEPALPSDHKGKPYAIADSAFSSCESITRIVIPEGVTAIGDVAFEDCVNLTSVSIPEGIAEIPMAAFAMCGKLTTVTLPASLSAIDDAAFYECTALKTVNYRGGEEQWKEVTVGYNNGALESAEIVYNYTGA